MFSVQEVTYFMKDELPSHKDPKQLKDDENPLSHKFVFAVQS